LKRRWLLLLPVGIALLAGLAWLLGRAPTRFVLEEECRRFYAERLVTESRLSQRIGKLEDSPSPELDRLKRDREANVHATKALRIRGWDVLLIPMQAPRPEPAGYLVLEPCEVSGAMDHPGLIGAIQVWVRPMGTLARLLRRLRLSP